MFEVRPDDGVRGTAVRSLCVPGTAPVRSAVCSAKSMALSVHWRYDAGRMFFI